MRRLAAIEPCHHLTRYLRPAAGCDGPCARKTEIVRDRDHGLAALVDEVAQDLEHLLARCRSRASRSARRPG